MRLLWSGLVTCSLVAGLGLAACGSTENGDSEGSAGNVAQPGVGDAGSATSGSASANPTAGAGTAGSGAPPLEIATGGAADIPPDPTQEPLPEPHAATPCDNPQPYAPGGGYLVCEDKSLRIGARSACPTTLPRAAPTDPLFFEECALDVDCTASPHGFCAYGQCKYGCVSDEECGADSLCFCGADVGKCVPAACRSDADCPADYPCTGNLPFGSDAASFRCQTPLDSCESDYDCPGPRAYCTGYGERRYCARDTVG